MNRIIRQQNAISGRVVVLVHITTLMLALVSCSVPYDLEVSPASTNVSSTPADSSAGRVAEMTSTPIDSHIEGDITGQSNSGIPGDEGRATYIQLDSPSQSFSVEDANNTTPEDVLREVSFSPDAGGGGSCGDIQDSFQHPTIMLFDDVEYLEWREDASIYVCGWQPDELVSHTVESTDEEIVFEELLRAGSDGGIYTSYAPGLNTPEGLYAIKFEGESGSVTRSVYVERPTEPRLYIEGEDKLILYNFRPDEHVRVFAYKEVDMFVKGLVAWDEYQVDNNGQLIVQLEEDIDSYSFEEHVVVGDLSGEVHVFPFTIQYVPGSILSPYSVTVFRPTQQDLQSANNLWRLAAYRDLREPGTQTYNVTVRSTDEWRWGFSWCAMDSDTLQGIRSPLSIEFSIDGRQLSNVHILEYDDTTSDGWTCHRWSTILTNWPPNRRVELEVSYGLTESIYDGRASYPSGEYHQVITVDVD